MTTPASVKARLRGASTFSLVRPMIVLAASLCAFATASAQSPGEIYFDDFGATDDLRMTAMNNWQQAKGAGGVRETVIFDARSYSFTVPIKLWSGMHLRGSPRPAREYTTGTVLNWAGATGTSMLTFTGTQTGQSYPSDGSPRDVSMENILFVGNTSGGALTHFFTKYDPTTYATNGPGHVLWYGLFHNCGWKNFATVAWGWWTGTTVSGVSHFQGALDTQFYLGGSENNVFGDGYAFGGTNGGTPMDTGGLPYFRSIMGKSKIGRLMFTSPNKIWALSIESSSSVHSIGVQIEGAAFDAQDSVPSYGAAIKISGGDGIQIRGCNFKGHMGTPASAAGGASANRGWIHITGGTQISIDGNTFQRFGNSLPATTVPLVWVGPSVGANQVKWGLNTTSGYAGAQAHIAQAAAGKIVNTDSSVVVDIAP